MKERPITVSEPKVRAILDGRMTQMRLLVKPQPSKPICRMVHVGTCTATGRKSFVAQDIKGQCVYAWPSRNGYGLEGDIAAPYAVGDRLWVRETWAAQHAFDALKPSEIRNARWHYAATEERGGLLWRHSIHMPRWASRITLEVTEVRVERLQDISEADAIAEGCGVMRDVVPVTARDEFSALWESIYGTEAWVTNPWVWVVEFKKVGET